MYGALFNKVGNIVAIAEEREESWASLFMSGRFQQRYMIAAEWMYHPYHFEMYQS